MLNIVLKYVKINITYYYSFYICKKQKKVPMIVKVSSWLCDNLISMNICSFFQSDFDKVIIEHCEIYDDFATSLAKFNWSASLI